MKKEESQQEMKEHPAQVSSHTNKVSKHNSDKICELPQNLVPSPTDVTYTCNFTSSFHISCKLLLWPMLNQNQTGKENLRNS